MRKAAFLFLSILITSFIITVAVDRYYLVCGVGNPMGTWFALSLILLILTAVISHLLNLILHRNATEAATSIPFLKRFNISCYSAIVTVGTVNTIAELFVEQLCGFHYSSTLFFASLLLLLSGWSFAFQTIK